MGCVAAQVGRGDRAPLPAEGDHLLALDRPGHWPGIVRQRASADYRRERDYGDGIQRSDYEIEKDAADKPHYL